MEQNSSKHPLKKQKIGPNKTKNIYDDIEPNIISSPQKCHKCGDSGVNFIQPLQYYPSYIACFECAVTVISCTPESLGLELNFRD
ncbi:putative orfan [Tupanvirus soda lake]|uniref:Orfan n=2 Tax=Tupanvirus TaxID=2094720 RepID=A0AC62AAL1_9VIRU|nr:putative orfan [Tupanvirus soda lake]QKU34744.1 putative orfan [Tupanvirus soda lake]